MLCIIYSVTLLLVRFGFALLMVGIFMLVMELLLVAIVIRLQVLSVGQQCFLSFSPSGLFFVLIEIILSVAQIEQKLSGTLYPSMTFAAIFVPPIAANENPIAAKRKKITARSSPLILFAYRCTQRFLILPASSFYCGLCHFVLQPLFSRAKLSAVAAARRKKHMPKRLRRFCHGFANPSLPRSPSAIFLFFLLWWLRLSVVKKIKKPPPHIQYGRYGGLAWTQML